MSEVLKIHEPYGKGIVPERWVERYGVCSVSTSGYALTACVVMEQLQTAERDRAELLAVLTDLFVQFGYTWPEPYKSNAVAVLHRLKPKSTGDKTEDWWEGE